MSSCSYQKYHYRQTSGWGGGVPLQMTSDRDVYCLHYVNTDLLYLLVLRQPVPRRPLQAIIDGLDLRTRDKRDAGDIM